MDIYNIVFVIFMKLLNTDTILYFKLILFLLLLSFDIKYLTNLCFKSV